MRNWAVILVVMVVLVHITYGFRTSMGSMKLWTRLSVATADSRLQSYEMIKTQVNHHFRKYL